MKEFIMNRTMNVVANNYPNYSKDKLEEIRYGLEGIYLTLTKTVIILLITAILGIFKQAIVFLIFFNVLRLFAFGLHAKKSWQCWISSIISFIGIPYLCMYLKIDNIYHYILICISILIFILYAPADTVKRPLIKKNRRLIFKTLTLIISILYIVLFINTNNNFIHNVITTSMLLESVLIHPLTYRMFNLPYKNYKRYVISK